MPVTPIRRTLCAALLLEVLALGACNDSGTGPLPEPELDRMRVTIGGQSVDVSATGALTGGPFLITDDVSIVTVAFFEADGGPSALVNEQDFRADLTSADTDIASVARAGAFTFELTMESEGITELNLALTHIAPDHSDFGPHDVPLQTVVDDGGGGEPNP
jgi:hypothetical protein